MEPAELFGVHQCMIAADPGGGDIEGLEFLCEPV